MAHEVLVPRLGWSMEEGILGDWIKQEGDHVTRGEPLFILEGEKATQDIESLDSGILRILPDGPRSGDTVLVGQLLGFLVEKDETPPFEEAGYAAPSPLPTAQAPPAATLPTAHSSASSTTPGRIAITPRARRLAGELQVDWTTVPGSGRDGRIRASDILSASRPDHSKDIQQPGRLQGLSPVRKVIARRLAEAAPTVPAVTLFRRIDAAALVAHRSAHGSSYTTQVIRLTATALRAHPAMNSSWTDQGIFLPDEVNIAFAVDTDDGLVAPVISRADTLDELAIGSICDDLTTGARAGALTADDFRGGTFTISNLGMYGVEHFTPLLNPPQCATLGIGAISPAPVLRGDTILPGIVCHLSLTFDHRIVDGAPAARFLDDICQAISGERKS